MSQSSVPTEQLFKELSLSLRNADPRVWEQWVACFDVYTMELLEQLSITPSDEVLRMQGRAQQCRALLKVYRTCHIPTKRPQPTTAPSE